MCLTTEGYVCLLAMELFEMNERGGRPVNAPADIENSPDDIRQTYLQSVVTEIVQNTWHSLDVESLKTDDNTGPELFCCSFISNNSIARRQTYPSVVKHINSQAWLKLSDISDLTCQ
jgi:hypothetical protein